MTVRAERAGLSFRDAGAGDVPLIVAMYAEDALGATREQATVPLPEEYLVAFREIEADPRQRLVVAEENGVVVATLQLSFLPSLTYRGSERAQIEAVRVVALHRGRGVGSAVFEWAISEARRRGCGIVQLTTDVQRPDAHRFYESLGFRPSHVGMKLHLRDP